MWLRVVRAVGAVGAAGGEPAVAYSIGRAEGSAVDRNRIRRRLRGAVDRHADELVPGVAYLFGADRRVLHAPFEVLDRAVGELVLATREMTE